MVHNVHTGRRDPSGSGIQTLNIQIDCMGETVPKDHHPGLIVHELVLAAKGDLDSILVCPMVETFQPNLRMHSSKLDLRPSK